MIKRAVAKWWKTAKMQGEVIGTIPFSELPPIVQENVNSIKASRKTRLAVSGMIALGYPLTGRHIGAVLTAINLPNVFRANSRVRKRTIETGDEISRFRHNPQFKDVFSKKPTHVLVDRKGNLHFVKAPEVTGLEFKPLYRRLRAPLKED